MNNFCLKSFKLKTRINFNALTRLNSTTSTVAVDTGSNNSIGNDSDNINIPKRIPRGPTDILRALSSTVGTDPTAPHFKYHDDPFLIPLSNVGKRTFVMAHEAGRKAAKWVQQENPQLFQHNVADPPVKAFFPQVVYNENSEVDLSNLKDVIDNNEVADSMLIYNLLCTKGIEIPNELKFDLLQLLCFKNHEDSLCEDLLEERWFKQSTTGRERLRKSWKDGDLAEKIFSEFEVKDSKLYSVMVRGMSKYFQVEKAWSLFQEALDKKIPMDLEAYNSILQIVPFLKDTSDLRWEMVKELLNLMSQNKLKPNIDTLNAVMSTISQIGSYKHVRSYTLETLAEFKAIGVEPSLATYYYVLTSFCRDRGPVSHVLVDILKEINGKEFKIQDIKDTYFFVTAMDICRNHLYDKDLAKQVNDILHTGNNYDLIGDSFKESIYYRHFFALTCQAEQIDKFMNDIYNPLVPNIYIPEPGVMEEILKAIDINGALQYIPKLWSDIVVFEHTSRESLLNRLVKIMIDNKPMETQVSIDEQNLTESFSKIAYDIFRKYEDQQENRVKKMTWTADMLGALIELCARNNDGVRCHEMFNKLDSNQHTIVGTTNPEFLNTYIRLCIAEKQPTKAIAVLQYSVDNGFAESEGFAQLINELMTLNEVQQQKIENILGNRLFK